MAIRRLYCGPWTSPLQTTVHMMSPGCPKYVSRVSLMSSMPALDSGVILRPTNHFWYDILTEPSMDVNAGAAMWCDIDSLVVGLGFDMYVNVQPQFKGRYHVLPRHITPHHITSHHITSHHITSHCITPYYIVLHCITLYCIALHHITLQRTAVHQIVSHPMPYYAMSCHTTSYVQSGHTKL